MPRCSPSTLPSMSNSPGPFSHLSAECLARYTEKSAGRNRPAKTDSYCLPIKLIAGVSAVALHCSLLSVRSIIGIACSGDVTADLYFSVFEETRETD